MKVLILSVTAGYGHHAAARAVSDELESRGTSVLIVDMFKYVSKALYDTIDKGYLFSTKYIPRPYGQLYAALEKNRDFRRRTLKIIVTEIVENKLSGFLEGFCARRYSLLHIFLPMVMDELKARDKAFRPHNSNPYRLYLSPILGRYPRGRLCCNGQALFLTAKH